jgi:hypothetical protein
MGNPRTTFLDQGVQPPSALYVTPDDYLRVAVLTSSSTSGLTLGLRILSPEGVIRNQVESLDGATVNTITTKTFPMGEGFLLGVVASNLGGGLADAVCFVSIGLQRGSPNTLPYQILAQDYVTNQFCVQWPAPPVRSTTSVTVSTYTPVSLAGTAPAAGAEFVYTIPAGKALHVTSVYVTFVASAVVGGRQNQLIIDDGTNILAICPNPVNVTANQSVAITWGSGLPTNSAVLLGLISILLQDQDLAPGWRIRSFTRNIDVGDQYGAPRICAMQHP